MRDDYKNQMASKMTSRYQDLELRIMQDIVRRIKKTGEITSTADWQINRLLILGYSSEDIENEIKATLSASYPEMFELYDKVIDWEYVRNKDIYEQINAEYIPFEENEQLKQITDAIVQQSLENLENVTNSLGFYLDYGDGKKIITPLSQVYTNYLDSACFDIVTGSFDYNTVLRRVVTQLTNSGLRQIEYASGRTNRVDVAARRAVMTAVSQITGKISEYNAKKLGTEYFEVEWHAGARPTHSVWQGRIWTEEQLHSVCGLGTVTGLLGANCYHTYYPFIKGISERNWPDDWLEEQNQKENDPKEFRGKEYTLYEAKQRQRQMETAMRAQREKVQMLQDGDADPDDVMLAKCKYQGQLDEYARFSKQMGLKQERERIYIDGRWRVAPGRIDKKLNVVNTMKISVPRDAYKIKGMTSEAKHEIEAAINNLKKEYDIRLDLIEVAKMEVGDIFGAAPYLDDRGKLRFALVINEDIDYNVVKKKIQRRYDKGRFAGKSIEDYIAHEMAHIMTYQDCKNEAEFRTRQRIVERQFMQGISQYADKTGKGEESLAEAFVRYRNKEKIPIRAELLIRSYIERWKK
nr:MAG TPA: minor capsid protein [Caudoviricetes sp.]